MAATGDMTQDLSDFSADDGENFVRREYARLAATYDRRWATYVRRSVAATCARLQMKPGLKLLDVGCGTGVMLHELEQDPRAARLTGVDLSPDMLAIARRRLGAAVEVMEAHAHALPFADESFDAVVSTSAFHFMRHGNEALCEMHRVLVQEGQIVITDWCRDFTSTWVLDRLLRVFTRAHYRTYGGAELAAMLRHAGFGDVTVDRYKVTPLWGLMTVAARKTR